MPAFPGAEGAGRFASGGRGTQANPTRVFEVTNLNDDNNPGSLRYALSQTAVYRTVVFRVSGTIHLNAPLIIKANTTIAGQTAPGDGICIADHPVVINGNNVIVRYIRIRMGDKNQNLGMVDGSGNGDALENLGNKNIIVDHCSISWSSDEALTIYRGDSISLQWNIISEPLNYSYHFEAGGSDFQEHSYIGIWGGRKASFHHNLLAHAKGRMPRFAGSSYYPPATAGQENADFRNNVVFNWIFYSTNGGEGGNYNLVNNYYKYGPSTSNNNSVNVPVRFQVMNPYKSSSLPYPKLFISGNFVDGSTTITQNNWRGVSMNGGSQSDTTVSKVTSPFTIAPVTTHTAIEAYDLVLNHAGTVLPNRDTLDERIANDVRNRSGKVIDVQGGYPHGTPYLQTINAWPALDSSTPPADSDKDGMPDQWENDHGLDPSDPSDRNGIAFNGYTHLENYLNSLASDAIIIQPSLTSFNQAGDVPSTVQQYQLSANHLTGNITIKAPERFEISANNSDWFDSNTAIELPAVNGKVNQMNIYVRMNAATPGNFSGNIRHTSYSGGFIDLPVTGTRTMVTSLPELTGEVITVFPNPAKTILKVLHPSLPAASVFKIFSINGQHVLNAIPTQGSSSTAVYIQSLPPGLYFIEISVFNKKHVVGFIKH